MREPMSNLTQITQETNLLIVSRTALAYASKKLNHAQRAYATLEQECLAVVWAVQNFIRYLYGHEYTLQTDHQHYWGSRRTVCLEASVARKDPPPVCRRHAAECT